LLAATIALNLTAARLLNHPLRQRRSVSSEVAGYAIAAPPQIFVTPIVTAGAPRVSHAYGKGRTKRWAL
jgi:O-antigen/teichoic acid export membrane protein